MPISSSPVSTPSAWCHVVWGKTHQCILSSAPPWCTQRRPSPSRGASSSSTTLTVSSQAFLHLALFTANKTLHFHVLFFILCPLIWLILLCLFILHPVSFSPPRLLSCFFHSRTLCPAMLLFPSSLNHFLISSYQTFLLSPPPMPPHFLSYSVPLKARCLPFIYPFLAFHSTFILIPNSLSPFPTFTEHDASVISCRC